MILLTFLLSVFPFLINCHIISNINGDSFQFCIKPQYKELLSLPDPRFLEQMVPSRCMDSRFPFQCGLYCASNEESCRKVETEIIEGTTMTIKLLKKGKVLAAQGQFFQMISSKMYSPYPDYFPEICQGESVVTPLKAVVLPEPELCLIAYAKCHPSYYTCEKQGLVSVCSASSCENGINNLVEVLKKLLVAFHSRDEMSQAYIGKEARSLHENMGTHYCEKYSQ